MFTFRDEVVVPDSYIIGFFEGLIVISDAFGEIYISQQDIDGLDIGDYIDDPNKIPLSNFEPKFQKVIRFLCE